MKDIEELLKAIIKKVKDKDASYIYGVEYSSTTKPGFKALVRFSKRDVQPVMFAASTKRSLKKSISNYLSGDQIKHVTLMYHEAQIELEEGAIRYHENRIEEFKVGKYEDPLS